MEKKCFLASKQKSLGDFFPHEQNYCLFFGAGFSKWAIDLPTANELFDFKIKIWGQREQDRLKKIQEKKKKWDEINPSKNAEQFIRDLIDQSPLSKKLVIWYIARRLTEPFIIRDQFFDYFLYPDIVGRRVITIDENKKRTIFGIQKARNLINLLNGPNIQGIITTNYDLLIEYGLGTKNFYYGNRPRFLYGPRKKTRSFDKNNPVRLKGSLSVIKLHGSISLTEKGYCTDGRGGITGRALIIPPAENKKISDILLPEWDYAKKILRSSKKIIFFGFGFNEYDTEIISLFKDTDSWIDEVIIIDPNSAICNKVKEIWHSAKMHSFHPDDLQLPEIITEIEKVWEPKYKYGPPSPQMDNFQLKNLLEKLNKEKK